MRLTTLCFLFFVSYGVYAADDYERALVSYQKNDIDTAYIHLKNALQNNDNTLSSKILMGKILFQKGYYLDGVSILEEALSEGADINLFLNDFANALILLKKYDQVIELKEQSKLSISNKVQALLLAGNAYLLLNNSTRARDVYKQAYELQPDNIYTLMTNASFEISVKRYQEAEKFITRAIDLKPNDSRVWHLKGRLYLQKEDIEQALAAFEQGYSVDEKDPVIQRSLIQAYMQVGDYDKGLSLVEKSLKTIPDDAYLKLLKSQLLSYTNHDEEAKELLHDITEKLSLVSDEEKASNSFLTYIAGTAAYLQNSDEVALNELQIYLNKEPNDLTTITMLVNIHNRQQNQDKALELLETKEKIILQDLNLSLTLFDLYIQNRKSYAAESLLKLLQKNYPNDLRLVLAETKYYANTGQHNKALALLEEHKPSVLNESYLLNKGLIYQAQGNYQKAFDIADELITKLPNSPRSLAFKGALYLQTQQWQQAIATFQKLLVSAPNDFGARYNLATANAALLKLEEAKKIADELYETYPDNIQIEVLLAKILRDTGKVDDAIILLKKVLNTNGAHIPALEALTQIYIVQRNYKSALEYSLQLNKLVFLNPVYLKQKAEIYIALNQFTEAKKQLDILLGISETAIELYELSQMQMGIRLYIQAKKTLEAALLKAPESIRVQLALVRTEIKLNNIKKAENLLASIAKKAPKNPNLYIVKAELLLFKNQSVLAQKELLTALKLDNFFTLALIQSYQLAMEGVMTQQFIALVDNIIDTSPNFHLARNLLADCYFMQQQFDSALVHYEKLIIVDDFNNKSFIYNNLANIYITKNIKQAEEYAKKAYDLNKAEAAIADTYGWLLANNKKYDQALPLLREAYAMNSEIPDISYHIAYTLNALGRKEQAKYELERLLAKSVEFQDKEKAQQLLAELSE